MMSDAEELAPQRIPAVPRDRDAARQQAAREQAEQLRRLEQVERRRADERDAFGEEG